MVNGPGGLLDNIGHISWDLLNTIDVSFKSLKKIS